MFALVAHRDRAPCSASLYGAIQGYFAGWTDIAHGALHRDLERDAELYMLIIFASMFAPSFWLLRGPARRCSAGSGYRDYVRAEFLRNRTLDYVRAARALGLSNRQIIWRHILPNSLTPVVTLPAVRDERRRSAR